MALYHKNGKEVSQDFYKELRARNKAALAKLPELREVLKVRSHKRAPGFSLQERAHGTA